MKRPSYATMRACHPETSPLGSITSAPASFPTWISFLSKASRRVRSPLLALMMIVNIPALAADIMEGNILGVHVEVRIAAVRELSGLHPGLRCSLRFPQRFLRMEDASDVAESAGGCGVGRGHQSRAQGRTRQLRQSARFPCSSQAGKRIGKKRVERLMRQEGIAGKKRKKFCVTTNSRHVDPIAPNIVQRHFDAPVPNAVWVTDVTYVWTHEGWLYLAAILDLCSRRVVGWATSANNDTRARARRIGAGERLQDAASRPGPSLRPRKRLRERATTVTR